MLVIFYHLFLCSLLLPIFLNPMVILYICIDLLLKKYNFHETFQILIMVYFLSYTFSLLSKYGIEETTIGGVVFDSNDFDNGDKMYFKVDLKRNDFNYDDIYYYYVDNIADTSTRIYDTSYTKTSYYSQGSTEYITKYFTIKKKKSQYGISSTGR